MCLLEKRRANVKVCTSGRILAKHTLWKPALPPLKKKILNSSVLILWPSVPFIIDWKLYLQQSKHKITLSFYLFCQTTIRCAAKYKCLEKLCTWKSYRDLFLIHYCWLQHTTGCTVKYHQLSDFLIWSKIQKGCVKILFSSFTKLSCSLELSAVNSNRLVSELLTDSLFVSVCNTDLD